MNLARAWAIVLRYLYLLRASPARVLPMFTWVIVDMLLWGFLTRYLNTITTSGIDFVPKLLGAVLLWDFFIRVMQGVTMAFFEDVWSRNFLNFFATPLRISEYVAGLVFSSIFTSTLGLIVMLLLATTVFGLSYFVFGSWLMLFLLGLFLFGISLGIFACALVLRLGPAAEWFVWPIPAILSPFAGVFYPIATLPEWMQCIAWMLPPAYVFEGMRSFIAGGVPDTTILLYGCSLSIIYLVLAAQAFVHTYRHALRTGLIARYSAETIS